MVTSSDDNTAKIFEIPTEAIDGVVCYIDRKINLSGASEGLGTYNEMCYQFKVNGVDTWSSVECSKNVPPGPVGSSTGRVEPDRSDFGLNGTGTTTDYKNVMIGDKKYIGFRDPNYGTDLNEYLREQCPNCKVQVVGYASTVGTFGDDRNDTLARLRAEWVKDYIQNNILDEEFKDKISVVSEGQGATDETASGNKVKCPTPDPIARRDNYLLSKNDEFGCKAERYVTVQFVDDPTNSPLADEKQNEIQNNQQRRLNIPVSRLLTECDYFERLEEDDKVVYDAISEKIKYFQPAFHSTTPEGFNARLTFLQQCMRQGKTKGVMGNSNPSNLAFGRPPVCILRIGDFYHTKIVIDNISLDYEPLVWDLNPEGVGVQPMICNVTMSFAFIGGSSLNGPISKLQNAVSFNYYANTEMYDSRSDYNQKQGAGGETKDGNQNANPSSVSNTNPASNYLAGGNPNNIRDTDQVAQNENANAATTANAENTQTQSDPDKAIFNNAALNGYKLNIEYDGTKLKGTFAIFSAAELSKDYKVKLKLSGTLGDIDICVFTLGGKDSDNPNVGEFISEKDGWKEALIEAANPKTGGVGFKVYISEYSLTYTDLKSIASYDCPTEFESDAVKYGDIVDYDFWQTVLNSPCCSCYPNGTGTQNISLKDNNGNIIKCPSIGCTTN